MVASAIGKDVRRLISHIRSELRGLETLRLEDEFEYASVPLCIIDAVFSIGVRYKSTRRTVCRFCRTQSWEMSRAKSTVEPTTSDLITLLEPHSNRLAEFFNNRQRTATR